MLCLKQNYESHAVDFVEIRDVATVVGDDPTKFRDRLTRSWKLLETVKILEISESLMKLK